MRVFAGTALVILAAIFFAAVAHTVFRQPVQEYQASLLPAYSIFAWLIPLGMAAAGVLLLASDRKRATALSDSTALSAEPTSEHTLEADVATPSPLPENPTAPAGAAAPTTPTAPTAEAKTAEQVQPEPPKRVWGAPPKVLWVLPSIEWILDPASEPPTQEEIDNVGRRYLDWLCIYNISANYVGGALTETHVNYTFSGSADPEEASRQSEGKTEPVPIHRLKSDHLLRMVGVKSGIGPGRVVRPDPNSDVVVLQVARTDLEVSLRRLMKSRELISTSNGLVVPLGEDLDRRPVLVDLAQLPHLFVGGATGSGKSVLLNSVLTSLLLTHTPDSLRLLLLDPTIVALGPFADAPHLLSNVADDRSAANVLYWVEREIGRRSQLFSSAGVSSIQRYNAVPPRKLPYVVVVIDELAGLGFGREHELSEQICRLVETGRALGIHMVISSSSPMWTGQSKRLVTNIGAKLVFHVAESKASYRLLGAGGAEQLPACGVAIFTATDGPELTVVRTPMVSDTEIRRLVNFWKSTPTASVAL